MSRTNRNHAEISQDLERAEECQKKQFAAIVRHVQRREKAGRAKSVIAQIRRDDKLCKLLVEYENGAELIGMMELIMRLDTAC